MDWTFATTFDSGGCGVSLSVTMGVYNVTFNDFRKNYRSSKEFDTKEAALEQYLKYVSDFVMHDVDNRTDWNNKEVG